MATYNDLEDKSIRIRELLVERASKNGGHLSSSLGVVEIIIALVEVFNFRKDKIIFDIGHQCHPYKILTEREKDFMSLGKKGGIAPYPSIKESKYDYFSSGHSGTSISAALGYSYNNKSYKSIALVGDGAFTSGQSFEALNHAGQVQPNLLIVYNDNGLSITKNIGALSNSMKVKKFIESLDFEYIGILDGHDMKSLIKELCLIKEKKHPVFFHIKTKKGKGYKHSEEQPIEFHCNTSFNKESGIFVGDFYEEEYTHDNKIIPEQHSTEDFITRNEIILERYIQKYDHIYFTSPSYIVWGLSGIARKYPLNVADTGITEQHCMTFTSALSLAGNKAIMFLSSWFMPRCYDQIIELSHQNISLTVVLLFGGIGTAGPTHQGLYNHCLLKALLK